MKPIFAILAFLGLAACATTDPGGAAGIAYKLPRTDATVTIGIDVKSCPTTGATVDAAFKIDPVAGADSQIYRVDGAQLASSITKRGVTVEVDTNGVISAVNTSSTDQGTVILGDVTKVVASVATFAAKANGTPVVICNVATATNLQALITLKDQITLLQKSMATAADPAAVQKKIDPLAAQLVAAKAALHVDLTAKLTLEKTLLGAAGTKPLDIKTDALDALFDTAFVGPGASTTPQHGLADDAKGGFAVSAFYVELPAPAKGLVQGTPPKLEPCDQYLVVPTTHYVQVTLDHSGAMIRGKDDGAKPVIQVIPANQLSNPSQLCLTARFGENRSVNLKFDAYGRTTEFAWTADARAANVAGALSGSASDLSTTVTTLQGLSLAADKKELDKLTTEQSLKKAKACQALLDAGATSCPS